MLSFPSPHKERLKGWACGQWHKLEKHTYPVLRSITVFLRTRTRPSPFLWLRGRTEGPQLLKEGSESGFLFSREAFIDCILTLRINSSLTSVCKSPVSPPSTPNALFPLPGCTVRIWSELASIFSSQMSGCRALEAARTLSRLYLS